MRKRAEEGLTKTKDDKKAQLRFELFKQNSDWVAIFDDLDRVSTNTINSMIDKIDTFSKETGLSVEVVKQLRDALEKLRNKSIACKPHTLPKNIILHSKGAKQVKNRIKHTA